MSFLRLKTYFVFSGILLKERLETASDGICQTLFISFNMSLSDHGQVCCSGFHQVSFSILVNIVFETRNLLVQKKLLQSRQKPKSLMNKNQFQCFLCHID